VTQADAEPGQRLAAWPRIFWMASGHAAKGADALQALLGGPAAQDATLPRARALATAAHFLQQTGGYAVAGNFCDAALAIARAAGDDHLVAGLLHVRAWLLDRQQPGAAMATGAFDAEYAEGRTLDLVRAAHQALQGLPARRAASSADMLASEPDAAPSGAATPVLTPRELDVLKLVAKGLSNLDIAQQLFLSEHTAHRHLANILRKLNLSSRAAAVAWGVRAGLV
jgi:DNA-binding CsgD family transcriptional regulator